MGGLVVRVPSAALLPERVREAVGGGLYMGMGVRQGGGALGGGIKFQGRGSGVRLQADVVVVDKSEQR